MMDVMPIKKSDTYDWLLHKHYAKRIPSISYSFGLFDNSVLIGVCTFGKPASNSLCVGICGEQHSDKVYELNRLCVNDMLPKNTLSFFVAKCLKLLPPPLILVSYADTSMGHHGYIYQATNWLYTGLSAKRTERYDADDPDKHSRHISTDMELRDRPQKHRYIYFIGDKRIKKDIQSCFKYKTMPYPKGDNEKYDASYVPQVQGMLL